MLILFSISCNPFYSHYGGPHSLLSILVRRIEPRTPISLDMCILHQPYLFTAKVPSDLSMSVHSSLLWRVMVTGQSLCFFAFVIMTFWMRTFQHISYLCCHKPIMDILKVFYSMYAITLARISSTVEREAFPLLGTKATFKSVSSYCYIIGWFRTYKQRVLVFCAFIIDWFEHRLILIPLYAHCIHLVTASSLSSPHQQPSSVCSHWRFNPITGQKP